MWAGSGTACSAAQARCAGACGAHFDRACHVGHRPRTFKLAQELLAAAIRCGTALQYPLHLAAVKVQPCAAEAGTR